tara:strand:+ start:1582 stop:1773 length:192 start_codon:yes stop_codon:yes gene_type:complete
MDKFKISDGVFGKRFDTFDQCAEWFEVKHLDFANITLEQSTPTDTGSMVTTVFITQLRKQSEE